jgi:hypothetical protein
MFIYLLFNRETKERFAFSNLKLLHEYLFKIDERVNSYSSFRRQLLKSNSFQILSYEISKLKLYRPKDSIL